MAWLILVGSVAVVGLLLLLEDVVNVFAWLGSSLAIGKTKALPGR